MFAWVEISDEKKGRREIQYSLGQDMSLDGRISYDCRTGEMQLGCLSDGASPQATRDFMEALQERLKSEPWGSGQAVCVSYERSDAAYLQHWRLRKQASFVRFC